MEAGTDAGSMILGIDVGSISISIAQVTTDKKITKTSYAFHKGNVKETLIEELSRYDLKKISGLAVTSSGKIGLKHAAVFDSRVSMITAARHLNKDMGSLLIIGGEKFGLALFDDDGNYLNYISNTSCAAGTGSFLDQQAQRLNLGSIEEFCSISMNNTGSIPKIASRCSVFAKTDLIHAQQEGYRIEEICDGLAFGLAKNVVDTLFSSSEVRKPVVFAGGVSKNSSVVKHISSLLNAELVVTGHSHVYGAIGAALSLAAEKGSLRNLGISNASDLIVAEKEAKKYYYPELDLRLSQYPDFSSRKKYEFTSRLINFPGVEVDVYGELPAGGEINAFLGLDIGSTSTKAIVMDSHREILAGFYTRTSGRPIQAVQVIFESMDSLFTEQGVRVTFAGAGTTGSGRKFIGKIIGADTALDEITAHARAAVELDSDVDTIIEIGGQDSKFTTLKNGRVTFSVMNNVCAAGTGSFIEEQAKKLGCPLDRFSGMAEHSPAPMSSDRCTVFMERDMNHYLSEGYAVSEILASVLHSVRDNYLSKVAVKKQIGDKIFFQGATAKNRALVAAFEQKLQKPVMVSPYCHLTGALGVALHLQDENIRTSSFRGLSLYRSEIPVASEICGLCTNHCKIKIAEIGGESVAFGFLCGRDYETKKFVRNEHEVKGLLDIRKGVYRIRKKREYAENITVGIPAALHIFEDMPFWEKFFDELSIPTVTSASFKEGTALGKNISAAEFCAPMSSLHGHVKYLADKADYIFLPTYLEVKSDEKGARRQYCYYTQYATPVIMANGKIAGKEKIIAPLVKTRRGDFFTKYGLYKALKGKTKKELSFIQISQAYDKALEFRESVEQKLASLYHESAADNDINVVFFGRPYTVLNPSMNGNIPGIFARLGIGTYFQDMIGGSGSGKSIIAPLLRAMNWKYGSGIMKKAEIAAKTRGMYPVFITSFKCTPDSFVMEYFKNLMDLHEKPYLILQLDDHNSNVGYETRIEAGIRAFRNHFTGEKKKSRSFPGVQKIRVEENLASIRNKTLLIPSWDKTVCRLLAAIIRHEGIDARALEETPETIHRSLGLNSGQCIPLTAIAQGVMEYVKEQELDPAGTALWNIKSSITCNLGMFPTYMKKIMESRGEGFEHLTIYTGEIILTDFSLRAAIDSYFAYMFGGFIRQMACRIRPYEKIRGSADRTVENATVLLEEAFEKGDDKEAVLRGIIALFKRIEHQRVPRPKVAIFGDLYARDNEVMNQNLFRVIEDNGGEVITTPYNEFMKIIAEPYLRKWFKEGAYPMVLKYMMIKRAIEYMEQKYTALMNAALGEAEPAADINYEEILAGLNVSLDNTGESMDNILKIFHLVRKYPDISIFVQANPSYCCPSLVTEAMAGKIEKMTGIPIVTIEYDGTTTSWNDDIIPYIKFPRKTGEERKEKIG